MSELISLLYAAEAGDAHARNRLFSFLYEDLRRMAWRHLRNSSAMTLSPTTLLHETFLNISQRDSVAFADAGLFISYVARAMRGLLIDHARRRRASKRGGELEITSLPSELPHTTEDHQAMQLDRLNDALLSLATIDPKLAECVDLKFFCGLSFRDIARLRGSSERTVRREWDKARLLLGGMMIDDATRAHGER